MDRPAPRRVLLVDPQRAFGQALWFVLDHAEGLECVGHVADLDALPEVLSARRPDVLLVAAELLDGDGTSLAAAATTVPVVVLGQQLDARLLTRAAEAGAVGAVARDEDLRHLVAGLVGAREGIHLDPHRWRDVAGGAGPVVHDLTRRELEVLVLLADGLVPRAIAERLCIGMHTTRGYVKAAQRKLGAHSALEAVALARAAGLV